MLLIKLLHRPYQMLFVDSVDSGSGPQDKASDQKCRDIAGRQSLNNFEKLSKKANEEHFRSGNAIQADEGASIDDILLLRHRRGSASAISSDNSQLHNQFAQNPGFCAESAPSDSVGGIMGWFQSDWEQKNIGKSPIGLHTHVDSLFSSSSGFSDFRGVLNLSAILLTLCSLRLALENLLKYGLLASPLQLLRLCLAATDRQWICLALLLASNAFIFAALGLELLAERGAVRGAWLRFVVLGNMALTLVVPSYVILVYHPSPFFSAPTMCICSILFLKLWSYHDVNSWCRQERRLRQQRSLASARNKSVASALGGLGGDADDSRRLVRYPRNLTLGDLYYFAAAPTLCYELNFPRLPRIRRRFLAKRCLELLLLPQLMAALVQQWMAPTLRNSLRPLAASEWPALMERLLKLAVPNHLVWLLFFYAFFHSALNVIGELLLFGDRCFYRDWWNCETVTAFWAAWNVPVHRFAKRHVFAPLLGRWRLRKFTAFVIVFAVSGFFHELMLSVPLRMFRLWAFSAMLLQVPLAVAVERFVGSGQLGNMAVWLSLILGQPLGMLMYFHDYYVAIQHGV